MWDAGVTPTSVPMMEIICPAVGIRRSASHLSATINLYPQPVNKTDRIYAYT